ncbi:hypothetical protein V6N11_023445 [Hibiscus sabdariffa]|uniref:RNase H type-1 domain-containing protein n=1 Tax=Hibiscus sabdariffa TaxID=183260 RepID=A0ABR2TMG2_9ROSI
MSNVESGPLPTWCATSLSIGVVVCDSFGLILDACALILSSAHSAKTAEVCAFARGIDMGVVNNWPNVIIESDSISVVKDYDRMLRTTPLLSLIWSLLETIFNTIPVLWCGMLDVRRTV